MAEVDTIFILDKDEVSREVATTSKAIKTIGLPTDVANSSTDNTSITHTSILKQLSSYLAQSVTLLQGLSNTIPASNAVSVTPHDSTNLTSNARSLYIGTSGNVSILAVGGSSTLFVEAQAGTILPIRTVRVNATGTTANNILALY